MVKQHRSLAAVLAVVALLLVACGGSASTTEASGSGGGSDGPSFAASTLDGGELASASLDGKPSVLWFWAPWCTICRAEAPDINAAAATFDGEVELIGVAGRGEVPEMEGFVSDTDTGGLTHIIDDDGSIWSDYGVVAQPAFAFVSADGSVEVVSGSLGQGALEERMAELAA